MSTALVAAGTRLSFRRWSQLVALAWFAVLGFDLLLNAGVMARIYQTPDSCVLPPARAFAFIPLGYAAFLLWTALTAWLMARLEIRGFRAGAIFGAKLGAFTAFAGLLAMASILAMPPLLLAGWTAGETLMFAIAGGVIGAGAAGAGLRKLALRVVAFSAACFVVTVALQNLGLAPAVRIGSSYPHP